MGFTYGNKPVSKTSGTVTKAKPNTPKDLSTIARKKSAAKKPMTPNDPKY